MKIKSLWIPFLFLTPLCRCGFYQVAYLIDPTTISAFFEAIRSS